MKLSKASFATVFLGSLLLVSGVAIPAATAAGPTAPKAGSAHPTYAGPLSGLGSGPLSGPYAGSAGGRGTFSSVNELAVSSSPGSPPSPNPKPLTSVGTPDPPTVSCHPVGPGCDTVSMNSGDATSNPLALDAVNSGALYGYDIEPPDQTLCAGNGYVMEVLNVGEMQVYDSSSLRPVSGVVSLDSLMGLTGLQWGSGGDISCLYDSGNGGHWFITEFVSTTAEPESPFHGCFVGVSDACREGIAVSATDNPMGAYNVYFFDPNAVNSDPGKGYLLNDFAKIGNTRDAFLLFYDEFNLNSATLPACPAFGCLGFNGAQEFAFNINAFELGLSVSSPSFNVAYENMGNAPSLYPIPANGAFQPAPASCFSGNYAGQVCWYQVIPAQSPDATQFDNDHGGTGFMVGSLDFLGAGDNRIATFDWTGLSDLLSSACSACGGISFGNQILVSPVTYMDEGAACPASNGGSCGIAAQKAGPIPLGDSCGTYGLSTSASCPESGIATNGDGATQVSYAQQQLWVAVSTLITQTFNKAPSEVHVGATYWVVGTDSFDRDGSFALTSQGYVTASNEDIEFPSMAGADSGGALMAFTLSGNGGPKGADKGGFYPSTAYGLLSATSGRLDSNTIHIADLGQAPQDGFSEYQGYPPTAATRPRWGDYSWAIFAPSTRDSHGGTYNSPGGNDKSAGGNFYFATEYIQSANCKDSAFASDPTCGGTRDPFANWGSSLNSLATGSDQVDLVANLFGFNLAGVNLQYAGIASAYYAVPSFKVAI